VTHIPDTGAASTRVVVRVAALRFGLLNVMFSFLLSQILRPYLSGQKLERFLLNVFYLYETGEMSRSNNRG
jgi:hypothetical protein